MFKFRFSLPNWNSALSNNSPFSSALAVQGTLKGLLQHHSSKASILQHSAFFIIQLSHPYLTTGKTIALTRWTFVGKVMSLLFNMLSRLVIAFLSRSKNLLISWLQSPYVVILDPPKIKSLTVSIVSRSSMKWWDQMPWWFVFWMLSFKPTFSLFSFAFIKRFLSIRACYQSRNHGALTSAHTSWPASLPSFKKILFYKGCFPPLISWRMFWKYS